ncbi:patatin-like phospholipase family protein [Actinomadura graeca]|uniref:Patatin-like phospholipase family protein n=1 Tax=Actinomadura graeca TaxID=2750812 RepID=A0ABX8QT71_9ACTN|nr:patatin-like phospholipase family protein [Actinomadura graeca]QXJ21947.1 patatin-like phospholipase family protein [Actinomadura graeca]
MSDDEGELARRARRIGDRAARRAKEPLYGQGAPLPGGEPLGLQDPVAVFHSAGRRDPRDEPVALVLAGGGAKGAYQAGVVRFLAEVGTPVTAISGASIGALNGAVVAAAPSLGEGADRLVRVWREVAEETGPPRFSGPESEVAREAADLPRPDGEFDEPALRQWLNLLPRLGGPMLSPGFLDGLVAKHVDEHALRSGIPMWVSIFPSVDPNSLTLAPFPFGSLIPRVRDRSGPIRGNPLRFGWLLDVVRGKLLRESSEWRRINHLRPEEIHNLVLASAGLPILLPPRNVDGRTFRDGGIGDNIPVGALLAVTDCPTVVVAHLNPRPLFEPSRFPELRIIEVMPSRPIAPHGPTGPLTGMIDLSPRRVEGLYELGYEDAKEQLGRYWRMEAVDRVADFLGAFRSAAVAELDDPL